MTEDAIRRYITESFGGVEVVEAMNALFFFFDPKHMFPFATLVTTDEHDQASNLSRPGVFRLNIGVSKSTFRRIFSPSDEQSDFTALDRLLPHPVYGGMYWLCVLNPSQATFERIKPLLAEAYQMAVHKHTSVDKTGGTID